MMNATIKSDIMECVANEMASRSINADEMKSILTDSHDFFAVWNLSKNEIVEIIDSIED